MPRPLRTPAVMPLEQGRRIWLAAQRLDSAAAFGSGPEATPAAVRHLGYVQIDTINVIERCHHHILWTRIPDYRRAHLHAAQSEAKNVFETWTHALSYVPAEALRFFLPAMRAHRAAPTRGVGAVTPEEVRRVVRRIRDDGPLTIRDIEDDVLVEKDHAWASRKPSKRALQRAFWNGELTVSARAGMLKTYELTARHFGWRPFAEKSSPRPAAERQVTEYMLDRALQAQGLVSLDSVCHLEPRRKADVLALVEARVRRRALVPMAVPGARTAHWAAPETLETRPEAGAHAHLLSPFDPLIIQRRRLALFFGYEHRFEAYVPKEKRVLGYFALPVLLDGVVVAALDLKADRREKALLIQSWRWIAEETPERKARIEEALHRFAAFQFPAGEAAEPDGDASAL